MRSIRGVAGRVGVAFAAFALVPAGTSLPTGLHGAPGETRAAATATGVPFVAAASTPGGSGLFRLDALGGVHTSGDARYHGSIPERRAAGQPIADVSAVDIVPTRTGDGYSIFDAAGGVHTFGSARYHGSVPALRAAGASIGRADVVAAAASPSGSGYWVLDSAGGIFTFGDARYFGSVPALRQAGYRIGNAAAVDITPTPSGNGYLVLDSAGGIFTFGDARYAGSIPALRQAGHRIGDADVRDVVVATDGNGYWVTDSVGGIFTFGDVAYHGSAPGRGVPFDLAATAVLPDGSGYWMVDRSGRTLAFGSVGGATDPSSARISRGGPHAFVDLHSDGTPVRVNPCRRHGYVVHLGAGAPSNARRLVDEAFDELGSATGIDFRSEGTTSERYTAGGRPWRGNPLYGNGIAPILVSFEPPNSTNRLGTAGGNAWSQFADNDAGRSVIVTGSVVVNTRSGLTADFAHGASYGAVLLHELGHVVGLDHVDDRAQIMSPVLSHRDPGTYQGGDLEGLAALGRRAGCVSEPAA